MYRPRKLKPVNNLKRFKASMERISVIERNLKGNPGGAMGLTLAPKEVSLSAHLVIFLKSFNTM